MPDHGRRIVPAESRQAGEVHPAHHCLLAFIQGIEAHEHIFAVPEDRPEHVGCTFSAHLVGKSPVDHAGSRFPLPGKDSPEIVVQGKQQVPDPEELLLHPGILRPRVHRQAPVPAEIAHEPLQRLALGFGKVGIRVLYVLELGDVPEKHPGIGKVLVHIVEITEDDISPEYEIVQLLRLRIEAAVAFVESQQQVHPVRLPGT